MYQALYRKWRPKTFDDVAGQAHITEILKNQIIAGRTSHAYLFTGTRGTGKTTCAKLLARAVNCQDPVNGNPCNRCPSCNGLESGEVLDVVELDAASNNGVDNVRALRDEALFSPVALKKRVYIIDETHMLSTAAFNALLKILEEPPEHLVFILATTELHKVPATIISRCQRYNFRRLNGEIIADRLLSVAESEGLILSSGAAAILSRLAEGSMRDALSLLDQCSGSRTIDETAVRHSLALAGEEKISALLNAALGGNTGEALKIFAGLWTDGKAADTVLTELAALLRDTLITIAAPGGALETGGYDADTLSAFASKAGRARLIYMLDTVNSALLELRAGRNQKISAELCLISLCEPELSDGYQALLARIEKLERRGPPEPPPILNPEPRPGTVTRPRAASAQIPEPEPEISPAPVSEPTDPGFFTSLLSELKGKLKIGVYNIITDPAQAAGALSGNTLTISAAGFARKMLGTAEVSEQIKQTAGSMLGAACVLRFDDMPAKSAPDADKLDGLLKFGNVKQID